MMLSSQVCTTLHGKRIVYELNCSLERFLAQPREEITVTMPDGSERKAKSWETSPMDVAKEVSKSLSERIVIAKVHPFFSIIHIF
jgi:threonyl-tRNA synthetase